MRPTLIVIVLAAAFVGARRRHPRNRPIPIHGARSTSAGCMPRAAITRAGSNARRRSPASAATASRARITTRACRAAVARLVRTTAARVDRATLSRVRAHRERRRTDIRVLTLTLHVPGETDHETDDRCIRACRRLFGSTAGSIRPIAIFLSMVRQALPEGRPDELLLRVARALHGDGVGDRRLLLSEPGVPRRHGFVGALPISSALRARPCRRASLQSRRWPSSRPSPRRPRPVMRSRPIPIHIARSIRAAIGGYACYYKSYEACMKTMMIGIGGGCMRQSVLPWTRRW